MMGAYTPHEEKVIFVARRKLVYASCFARLGLVQPRARLVQCRQSIFLPHSVG